METLSSIGFADKVRMAFTLKKNRLTTYLGFFLGGLIPFLGYMVAHFAVTMPTEGSFQERLLSLASQFSTYVVLGALGYSAPTVAQLMKEITGKGYKGVASTILLEGIMVGVSTTPGATPVQNVICVSLGVLSLLVVIALNGLYLGVRLSLEQKETRAQTKGSSRRSRNSEIEGAPTSGTQPITRAA